MTTYTDPTIVQLGEKPRLQSGTIITLIAGIISVLGVVGFLVVTSQVSANTEKLEKSSAQSERRLKELDTVATQLTELDTMATNLHSIFDKQKRWEAVLGTVEQRFYRNMAISSMTFTEQGELTFTGYARDYVDYAKIFRSLTDENGQRYFSLVKPGVIAKIKPSAKTAVANVQGIPDNYVTFSFTLTLQPTILNTTAALSLADLIAGVNKSGN
ncbi:hypothetical protein BH11PAT4_BH11PAT4_3290 [soil metagenome]